MTSDWLSRVLSASRFLECLGVLPIKLGPHVTPFMQPESRMFRVLIRSLLSSLYGPIVPSGWFIPNCRIVKELSGSALWLRTKALNWRS